MANVKVLVIGGGGGGASFQSGSATLPTTTVANKTIYVGCKYNSADNKWDVLAVGQEA